MQDAGPVDPNTLPDTTELWRRIPLWPPWIVVDENEGRVRPPSGAFKDNKRGSVSAFVVAESGGPNVILAGHDNFRLVVFDLALVRACGLTVERDEAEGSGHVLLIGSKTRTAEIDGERMPVADALARKCRWFGDPPRLP